MKTWLTVSLRLFFLAFLALILAVSTPALAAFGDDYVFTTDDSGKLTRFHSEVRAEIDVTVPDGVTAIGYASFPSMVNYTLRSVTLPSTVTAIESNAFEWGLRYLVIPPSVTSISPSALCDGMGTTLKNVTTIFCEKDSEAHRYAVEHGFTYILGLPDAGTPNNPQVREIPAEPLIGTSQFVNVRDTAYDFTSIPDVQTVLSDDGSVSVLDTQNAIVYEFTPQLELTGTVQLPKVLERIGAFTKDKMGNYYVFYAQPVEEGAFQAMNMALVQFGPDGSKTREVKQKAQRDDEKWGSGYSGVMDPFQMGACRLEISGDMIAVYFAREQFVAPDGRNHQSSYGFIWDLSTLELLSGGSKTPYYEDWDWSQGDPDLTAPPYLVIPGVSHSFNQYILPIDGGFLFADHGDGSPRAFAFEKVVRGAYNVSIDSFSFPGGFGENYTGAIMGELAETDTGYLFLGAYNGYEGDRPYNLFVQTISEDLTVISDPIYLTNHTKSRPSRYSTKNISAPKLVQIDKNQYLVLWQEHTGEPDQALTGTLRTYSTIVDGRGSVLQPTREIMGIGLQENDVLRYSPATRRVVWAKVERGYYQEDAASFRLYSLDPFAPAHYAPPVPPERPSSWATEQVDAAIAAGLVPERLQGSYTKAISRGDAAQMFVNLIELCSGQSVDAVLAARGAQINAAAFTDTTDKAVLAANALGIINGVGDSRFDPGGTLTRGQAAAIINRVARVLGVDTAGYPHDFVDVAGHWADSELGWPVHAGIVNGVGEGRYNPDGQLTTEQAIVIAYRAMTGISS